MKYKLPFLLILFFFHINEFYRILALSLKSSMTQHPQTNDHVFILRSSSWMNHNFRTHGTFSNPSTMGRSRTQCKKCHVHTSSIHGDGFVGIGSLWPSSYYIPHPNIFVLDVVYNLKCFNMGSNVSIPF